jgi:hypothetical protein
MAAAWKNGERGERGMGNGERDKIDKKTLNF